MNKINWNEKSILTTVNKHFRNGEFRVNTTSYSTGFDLLDKKLNGGLSKGLYCIGSIPGIGKSTLIMQIAENISSNDVPVVVFSLEMDIDHLTDKAVSRERYLLRRKGLKYSDAEVVKNVMEKSKELYVISYVNSAAKMEEYIDDFVNTYNKVPVIMVDYLQMMSSSANMTDKQTVDSNIYSLKCMGFKYKTPIVVVSSFNRDGYDGDVTFKSFKDSGSIEYDFDVVIGLKKMPVNKTGNISEIQLVILKQKYGKSGEKVNLLFYPEYSYYEEKNSFDKKIRY